MAIFAMEPLFLEDLSVGQQFQSGVYRMDAGRIQAFAAEFDPQPFHLDETAAQASLFQGLAASGWHTAAVAMSLLVPSMPFANGLIGFGGELSWPNPTRPGDVLQLKSEILEIIPSRSKPSQGVVVVRSTMANQDGKVVYVFTAKVLAFRRPFQNR
jgi:acyl dehydratase